jgi:hypothetical protein
MAGGAILLLILSLTVVSREKWAQGAAYPVKWNPGTPEAAYPVKWNPGTPEAAYPVKWNPGTPEAAYPVKWNPSTPEAAYPVKWNPSTPEAAYPVKWNPSTPEAAYPVKWNPYTSEAANAYLVKWNPYTPGSAYAVTWSPSGSGEVHVNMISNKKNYKHSDHLLFCTASDDVHRHEIHVKPGMLFRRTGLYPGAILPEGTKLGGDGSPTPLRFMFKANTEAIPFSYNQRETILRIFGIPHGSQNANQVTYTLQTCQEPMSQPHTCATSQQEMIDFAADVLGTNDLRAIVTTVHGEEATAARYVVAPKGITHVDTKDAAAVACHPMPYPYMVHFCHRPQDVHVLRVDLMRGLHDVGASAVAICHSDTRNWDARYFDMLNATRGEEICHFMPHNYITWVRM